MIPEIELIHVIGAVQSAAERLGIPFLLVGAYARDLRLKERIDISSLRATGDIDFAFAVRDWDHYRAMRQALLDRSEGDFAPDQREKQRLIFSQGLPVDLVPFGGVADAQGRLFWPPEGTPMMNVRGFEDALASADPVDLGPLQVRVVSLPAMALLKLMAWNDRPEERTKDIEDFALLLRRYHEVEDESRIFSSPDSDLLESDDFDYDQAWHRIFGRDVGRMISLRATGDCLLQILSRETAGPPYNLASGLRRFFQGDFEKTLKALQSFERGVRDMLER